MQNAARMRTPRQHHRVADCAVADGNGEVSTEHSTDQIDSAEFEEQPLDKLASETRSSTPALRTRILSLFLLNQAYQALAVAWKEVTLSKKGI
jgi:hypothetical protein